MADIIFLVLLFVHVITVVFWMGASILFVSVLGPSMAKLTASSRMDFSKTIGPAYANYNIRNATVAVAAGLILYAYITQPSSSLAPSSSGMYWIFAGVLLGLGAYIIGIILLMTNRRQMKLMSQAPTGQPSTGAPPSEMANLQRRMTMSAGLQAVFLMVALLCMVVGANIL